MGNHLDGRVWQIWGTDVKRQTRIPGWGTDSTSSRTVSLPTCWSLGRSPEPPIAGIQTQRHSPDASDGLDIQTQLQLHGAVHGDPGDLGQEAQRGAWARWRPWSCPRGWAAPPPQLRALLGKHTLPKGLLRPPRVPSTVHSVFIVPLPSSQRHKIDLRVKKSLSSHNFSCLKPNDSFPLCLIFFFSRTF